MRRYWQILGIWTGISLGIPVFFPISLGIVFVPTPPNLPTKNHIVLEAEKMKEQKISFQTIQNLQWSIDNEKKTGVIHSEKFSTPIEKQGYQTTEQLQFLPVSKDVLLSDVARIEKKPITQANAYFFSSKTGLWEAGEAKEVFTRNSIIPLARWMNTPENGQWIPQKTQWVLWWQVVLLFAIAVGIWQNKRTKSKKTDNAATHSIETHFQVQGIRIKTAQKITKQTPSWNIALPLWVIIFFIISGSGVVWTLSYIPNQHTQIHIALEQHSREEQFFTKAQEIMQQHSTVDALYLPHRLIIESTTIDSSPVFLKKTANEVIYVQQWNHASKQIKTPEEAQNFIKNNDDAFWIPQTHQKKSISPNFSAIQEHNVSWAEMGAFFSLFGNDKDTITLDNGDWHVKNENGEMIPVANLLTQTPAPNPSGEQTVYFLQPFFWGTTIYHLMIYEIIIWLGSLCLVVFFASKSILPVLIEQKKR